MPKPKWIKDEQVRKKVPKGHNLPVRFDDLVAAAPDVRIEWQSLEPFGVKRSAHRVMLPFMRLPTGGLVTLWYHAAEPAVVYFGDEGELDVLAMNFNEFLKGLATRNSGLPDFDEAESPLRIPNVKGRPKKAGLAALQEKFDSWFKENTSLQEPDVSPDSDELRKSVIATAKKMIADGKSKVHTSASEYWQMHFKIERKGKGISLTYLDFGKWYAIPMKYGLIPLAEQLIARA